MMERIVRSAEATLSTTELSSVRPMASPSEIIGHGIATMMERFTHHKHGITAILAITREGHSARMIAKYHPDVPIIAATHSRQIARQLVLSRGIMPMLIEEELSEPSTMTRTAILQAVQEELLCREDTVLTVSGSGWAPQSPTNVIGLFTVQDVLEDKAPPLV
jgi:pyruvate kinase